MTVNDVIAVLEELSPPEYACDWDNVGLIIGDRAKEVHKILVAVDVHQGIADRAVAEGVDLIISHHPMIFSGIKKVNTDDFTGRKIMQLIQNDIAVYAMHTNFDIKGSMAEIAAGKLWLNDMEVLLPTAEEAGLGVIGEMAHLNLRSFAFVVKDTFEVDNVKVYGNLNELVHRIAILPGSGRSAIGAAVEGGADVLITGDISHHDGLDAVEMGLKIIDAGHYGVEKIFIDFMSDYIREHIPGPEILTEEKKERFTWL
ncbi:MAG: Nif3-like dinuclear metal center hexameric protein [Eubacteriales bacterium]|nr:Nif3-like dinuclear metal center hexameric protein [Eubacteriales bacterium]